MNINIESANLQSRLKNKKNKIEELLGQNEESIEIELNNSEMKSKVKSNKDPTSKIKGNTILKKRDSKIVRQQTGFNRIN